MEKVILVGRRHPAVTDEAFSYSMEELESLTHTAGGDVLATLTQARQKVDPATYIGSGKVEELKHLCEELEIDSVIFNDELSPSQQSNLALALDAKVIDRTQLILDIFASRARSREGRLQVELAQLNYLLPRLTGLGLTLSRQGGGIGTRGPGETQLESDRRHIRRRIGEIKKQLSVVVRHREQYRERRRRNQAFKIALVGYTNAGKSTLFNQLTDAEALEENKLFATLDPLTRRFRCPDGLNALMTDTVGFIQHLPTALVAAFRSTLEEVKEADLLIHVVDASHSDHMNHIQTVEKLLRELDAEQIPTVLIFNKKDLIQNLAEITVPKGALLVSAFDAVDLARIKQKIQDEIVEQSAPYRTKVEAGDGGLIARLRTETIVTDHHWDEESEVHQYDGYVWTESPLFQQLALHPDEGMDEDHV
ncbi:GTP-binding protein HflX [Pullulanibacillus pueri]|uniref:GTPase HflX n=1 Tax=Pullulanibacillus pueri TaxID=1437324 RepID=A0A8J2ZZQ5_9BACL|nr:GTPase HflX [Pullulanibacillus pueri]MBM7684144.1 GTP-binding protein HflX [Pullulanibacillus pueri]GGH88761.1 GTPase HflX [Pullulanibacillus pueri]